MSFLSATRSALTAPNHSPAFCSSGARSSIVREPVVTVKDFAPFIFAVLIVVSCIGSFGRSSIVEMQISFAISCEWPRQRSVCTHDESEGPGGDGEWCLYVSHLPRFLHRENSHRPEELGPLVQNAYHPGLP